MRGFKNMFANFAGHISNKSSMHLQQLKINIQKRETEQPVIQKYQGIQFNNNVETYRNLTGVPVMEIQRQDSNEFAQPAIITDSLSTKQNRFLQRQQQSHPSIVHSMQIQNPEKEAQHKLEEAQKLKKIQKRKHQLLQRLKLVDKKIQQIKREENPFRESQLRAFQKYREIKADDEINSLQKHEKAMSFVKRMIQERKKRDQKKIEELDKIREIQRQKLQKIMQQKRFERQERRRRLMYSQVKKTYEVNYKQSPVLPIIKRSVKETVKDVSVQFNPNIKSFAQGKSYKQVVEEEKILKLKQQTKLQQVIAKKNKQRDYGMMHRRINKKTSVENSKVSEQNKHSNAQKNLNESRQNILGVEQEYQNEFDSSINEQ